MATTEAPSEWRGCQGLGMTGWDASRGGNKRVRVRCSVELARGPGKLANPAEATFPSAIEAALQ